MFFFMSMINTAVTAKHSWFDFCALQWFASLGGWSGFVVYPLEVCMAASLLSSVVAILPTRFNATHLASAYLAHPEDVKCSLTSFMADSRCSTYCTCVFIVFLVHLPVQLVFLPNKLHKCSKMQSFLWVFISYLTRFLLLTYFNCLNQYLDNRK